MKTKSDNTSIRQLNVALMILAVAGLTSCVNAQSSKQTSVQPAPPATPVAAPGMAGLPSASDLQRVVDEAYAKFKDDHTGKNADYIPYLASVSSNLFGVAIVTADGQVFTAGDVNYAFSIQSCSKVFTLCQVMQESGEDAVFKKIGVEPTGMPFNSVVALGMNNNKAVNPLVNAGAMASVSLVKGQQRRRTLGQNPRLSKQVRRRTTQAD